MRYWRKPLDEDKVVPIRGEVEIIPDRCKGCGFCIRFCPRGVLEESPEFNQKGYHYPRVARPDRCAGCGLCEMLCPDFAIHVTTARRREAAGV